MKIEGRRRSGSPRPASRKVARRATEDAAVAAILAVFSDATEEDDYIPRCLAETAALTAREHRALRRSIEALRGMRVIRAQEMEDAE